jgi:hypothetical protein
MGTGGGGEQTSCILWRNQSLQLYWDIEPKEKGAEAPLIYLVDALGIEPSGP